MVWSMRGSEAAVFSIAVEIIKELAFARGSARVYVIYCV